ncbi:Synaptonemal complex protein [Nymphaea thermarum]|nr:Synaptonemal complex protein [Nymphaea thermarum]
MERSQAVERVRIDMLIAGKDAAVQQLDIALNEQKMELGTLDCQLQDAKTVLRLKEDLCASLAEKLSQAEKDKAEIQCRCENFEKKWDNLIVEMNNLEDEIYRLKSMVGQLDTSSLTTSKNILQLTSSWENYDELIQQEKLLLAKSAKLKFDLLHARYLEVTSENGVFQSEVEVLKNQVIELRRDLDAITLQRKEEREIAGEKIQKSQLELERFRSKETELMATIAMLEEKVSQSSKIMSKFEDQKQELKMQILSLESLNRDIQEKAEFLLQGKKVEIESLHEDIEKNSKRVESLEIQISLLRVQLDEKEKTELNLKEKEKELVEKIVQVFYIILAQKIINMVGLSHSWCHLFLQVQSSHSAVECSLAEAKKQYEMMLEAKQLELMRHLKEISQRNDQEINDIRRKYELEKQEVIKLEKEKANNILTETEKKHEEALKQLREKELEHLQQVQDEHDALVKKIQFEFCSRELGVREKHDEEKKGLEIHWENELREKTMSLRREHEAQMKIMVHEHQDDLRKVQEELELQKSKEEKQKALLQLQWKVMDDNRQDDPEGNSKKAFSASSIKMLDTDVGKRDRAIILENEIMNSAIPGAVGFPANNLLKVVEGRKPSALPKDVWAGF